MSSEARGVTREAVRRESWRGHFQRRQQVTIRAIGAFEAFAGFGVVPADFDLILAGWQIAGQGRVD